MIFMYSISFSILGAQFIVGDIMGVTMTDINGDPLKSSILATIQVDQLNTSAQNVIGTNQTSIISDPITAAAGIAWELILLMTGTYVFQVAYLLGIPSILIAGMVLLYIILLMRTIIAYLRGI